MAQPTANKLQLITGENPDPILVFAAAELRRYAGKLFGLEATISTRARAGATTIFLAAPAAGQAPPADDQAILLRRFAHGGQPAFLATGGSPAATLWAVYDLVEKWGVRYLLHGDVFPATPPPFHLPAVDRQYAPNLRLRCWRLINDFVCGCESWSLAENCRFIDQLAKLKFNEIFLSLWPWQSYLHYEFAGVAKRTGVSWFGWRYPIDEHTVGRQLFGSVREFENPDLAGLGASYQERCQAAQQQARGILAHARARGMKTGLSVPFLEYPLEFKRVLPGAQDVHQCGQLTCGPGPDQDPDDPLLHELIRTIFRAAIDTYADFDYLYLQVPEHRAWMEHADDAAQKLDSKYGIAAQFDLHKALGAAAERTRVHGGAQRQVDRVKADLVTLYMLDQVFADGTTLARAHGKKPALVYSGLADELWPLLAHIAPPHSQLLDFVDYTARRVVDQIDALDYAPVQQLPSRFIFTLEDDNIGLLPQLATKPLHEIATRMRQQGWQGFCTRYWTIGCHDLTAHYLGRSSWDADLLPAQTCAELVRDLCGAECVPLFVQAWELIEEVTDIFDRKGLGFAFTVAGMMMKHWEAHEPLPAVYGQIRQKYQRAFELLDQVAALTRDPGRELVHYMRARLEFGTCYIDAATAAAAAGVARRRGRDKDEVEELEKALTAMRKALEAYAGVAADNSDRGALAALDKYCYRPLRAKLEEVR